MYTVKEHADSEPRKYYRCPIDADQSAAKLKIGRSTVRASVLEKSIDGYSLLIKKRYAKRLRLGSQFRMNYDGTSMQVQVRRISDAEKGYRNIGLALTKDLTKPPQLKSSWWPSLRPSQKTSEGTAQIAFAGFVLLLFCAMAMPGLGDRLGTSDRIQDAFRWAINTADAEVTSLSR
ncbi:hypothetical protein [Planctomycetes bacterium K23_9]|uniref:Uncharacterized protein n=1 Tax=Stieleria marina TaxID=1930275 RepID=A0A517NW83_9BACT|nr:hypothetical protein K239x_33830 [Planctomycetes bacterium K23_9]